MILIFIAAFLTILCSSMFFVTFQVNGINRAVVSVPMSFLEVTVPVDDIRDHPYFDRNTVINNLTSYYDKTILKYTSNYDAEFYFYNSEDFSYCINEKCSAVEVTITANLMYEFHYKRVMFYEIFGE